MAERAQLLKAGPLGSVDIKGGYYVNDKGKTLKPAGVRELPAIPQESPTPAAPAPADDGKVSKSQYIIREVKRALAQNSTLADFSEDEITRAENEIFKELLAQAELSMSQASNQCAELKQNGPQKSVEEALKKLVDIDKNENIKDISEFKFLRIKNDLTDAHKKVGHDWTDNPEESMQEALKNIINKAINSVNNLISLKKREYKTLRDKIIANKKAVPSPAEIAASAKRRVKNNNTDLLNKIRKSIENSSTYKTAIAELFRTAPKGAKIKNRDKAKNTLKKLKTISDRLFALQVKVNDVNDNDLLGIYQNQYNDINTTLMTIKRFWIDNQSWSR